MAQELVVANIQMTSNDDVKSNLKQIESLLEKIFASASPRLVTLPENCLYFRVIEGQKIQGFEFTDAIFQSLANLAVKYNCYLHLGSVPLYLDRHLYNSSVLITSTGKVLPGYQKMHLFDIQLEGQNPIRESDVFRHGQRPNTIEIDGWLIGESICYDLRFAELYSQYARKNVDLILVPAAFLVKTGEAHWEVLLRARAIESQAYLIASAQGGTHHGVDGGVRATYGHALIVDPWGVLIGQVQASGPGYSVAILSKERIQKVREQIPMKIHRRLPVA